jgi:hypothetical protein
LNFENGTEQFFSFVYELERSYRELILILKTHSQIGSRRLFWLQAKQSLARLRIAIARASHQLGLTEQLESKGSKSSSQQTLNIQTWTAKFLYIARDEQAAESEKCQKGPRNEI